MQVVLPCLSRRLAQCRPTVEADTSRLAPRARIIRQARCFSRSTRALQRSSTAITPSAYSLQRQEALSQAGFKDYPRFIPKISRGQGLVSISSFRKEFDNKTDLEVPLIQVSEKGNGETVVKEVRKSYNIAGRVTAIRVAGPKLLFIDLIEHAKHGPQTIQAYIELSTLQQANPAVSTTDVEGFVKLVQKGDRISVVGRPYRTKSGQFSLAAEALPILLAPSLHMAVKTVGENSDHAHNRYVHMLTDPSRLDTLRARSEMTPILAASAGGAAARPFTTTATEFPGRKLALRIAPELWLKKLIVGGLNRVYEIGPSFRNEGIDKTHNPEFTTCEFYAVLTSIKNLRGMTEQLINKIAQNVDKAVGLHTDFKTAVGDTRQASSKSTSSTEAEWPTLDFFTTLHQSLGQELPDLSGPNAREAILEIFRSKNIPIPSVPTLPRLLDKLCATYIEPRCHNATWIINHPECLSPLAKSEPHKDYPSQRAALRAELFIHRKEVVNCYEEENSPFEQRRKFIDQQRLAHISSADGKDMEHDDEAMEVDEDYIRALEWGMPPTGGWGCGLDRLLMLMLGKKRIEDVLTFGNLRSVTGGAEKIQRDKSKAGQQPS